MKKLVTILLAIAMPLGMSAALKKKTTTPEPIVEDTLDTEDSDEPLSLDELDMQQDSANNAFTIYWRNDSVFISCDQEALPNRLVFVTNDGNILFKQLHSFSDSSSYPTTHPAADIYSQIWTNERVNPYHTPIDSLADSIHINMAGFRLPHPGYVTSRFGFRRYRFHYGTDIKVQVGDSIRSTWDGQVRIVGWDPRGYGHYVVIRHDNGLETVYGHLSQPLFDENERIFAGEVLGLGGNTGRSTGSHLHYEIRYLGNAINPELVIDLEKGVLRDTTEYIISKKGTFGHKEEIKQLQQAQYHRVRSGDTLSAIARKYRTTVKQLCRLNRIKETSVLQIGQKVRVR